MAEGGIRVLCHGLLEGQLGLLQFASVQLPLALLHQVLGRGRQREDKKQGQPAGQPGESQSPVHLIHSIGMGKSKSRPPANEEAAVLPGCCCYFRAPLP